MGLTYLEITSRLDEWVAKYQKDSKRRKEFRRATNDIEKYRLARTFLAKFDIRITYSEKSLELSNKWVSHGDSLAEKNEWAEAVLAFNMAIIAAPWPRDKRSFDVASPLIVGLCRRAQALLMTERYVECLADADHAITLLPPDAALPEEVVKSRVKASMETVQNWQMELGICMVQAARLGFPEPQLRVHFKPQEFIVVTFGPAEIRTEMEGGTLTKRVRGVKPTHPSFLSQQEKLNEMKAMMKGRHRSIPAAADSIDRTNEAAGWPFVAKKNLHPGDIVLVEAPFVASVGLHAAALVTQPVLDKKHSIAYCYSCYKPTEVPYPCCTCSLVVYCSPICTTSPKSKLHAKECKFLPTFLGMDSASNGPHCDEDNMDQTLILVMRTLLMKTWDEWTEFANKVPVNGLAAGSTDSSLNEAPKKKRVRDEYEDVFSLEKKSRNWKEQDLLRMAFLSTFIMKVLENGPFQQGLKTDDGQNTGDFLGGLALHHLQNFSLNAQDVNVSSKDGEMVFVGKAVHPTLARFSYSCDPNLLVTFFGDTAVASVRRPVKIGDVLTVGCLQAHYGTQSRLQRQKYLEKKYLFTCQCRACDQDWPTLETLKKTLRRVGRFKPNKRCPECGSELNATLVTDARGMVSLHGGEQQCRNCNTSGTDICNRINRLNCFQKMPGDVGQFLLEMPSKRLFPFMKDCHHSLDSPCFQHAQLDALYRQLWLSVANARADFAENCLER